MNDDPILQPIQLGALHIKNRIFSTGHAPSGYLEGGLPGERYALYQEEKAKGGLGLTIIGGSSNVARDSANVFDQIPAWDDRVLPFYRDVSQRVHDKDAAIMIQLTHLGRRSKWDVGDWLVPVGPSPVRERSHRSIPRQIEDFDFERIAKSYGEAAARARDGGLDGIELAAMAGHLIDQFWQPRTNKREDEWGRGSLEDKMRFTFMVLEEIRHAVGDDFVVGMRIPGDEGIRDGLTSELSAEIARALAGSGYVDFFSVVYGSANTDRELSGIIPPFGSPLGQHVPVAHAIKEVVDIPILHAGRVADVATARHAIEGGLVDMVGMTRAMIADPHVVRKVMEGAEERIRPCVGATYCASRVETFCLHNPATGREKVIPHLTPRAVELKRVVVIGGGPAGLEAARVSAERGHAVTLFEANTQVGGQVSLAARTDRHSEKIGITQWLASEAIGAGAEVRTNTLADAEMVRELDPDVVIVATGGLPNLTLRDGGAEYIESTWDMMSVAPVPGQRVLIFDDHGGEHAITAAERLGTDGARVEIVTPDRLVAQEVGGTIYPDYFRRLYAAGVTFTPDTELVEVRRSGDDLIAVLSNAFTDERVERVVDRVVVEQGTLPVEDVYQSLRSESSNRGETDIDALITLRPQMLTTNPAGSFQLFRIGDAVAGRNIHAAIYDARRLCLAV